MKREEIERLIRRAYDIGYKEGLYDSKKPNDEVVSRLSDEDMVSKFLEDNAVTVIEPKGTDSSQTSAMRLEH